MSFLRARRGFAVPFDDLAAVDLDLTSRDLGEFDTVSWPMRDTGFVLTCTDGSAPRQTRTANLRIRRPLLYPLSYGGWGSGRRPDRQA
jgi:hypothetical protein